MDAKADATSQNDKIFENYKLKFSSAEMYLEIAGKFAAWLKDVRAYYAKAQPKVTPQIILLSLTVDNYYR